ncbi:hypothetical protein [Sediminibacterium sp.]|uniref:hypothetical protein n=1 Tax=Sediminibacterium sp. TaxID=1917865 RepID=UPI003F6950EE
MSNYKARSNYFKLIATKSKLIAHDEALQDGGKRVSFHRINAEDEFNAACKDWAHFPAVVHIGHSLNYKSNGTGLPNKVISNHLYFLTKLDLDTEVYKANAIEKAYEKAEEAMDKFISYMLEDYDVNGSCGNLFVFDLSRASAEMIGPINQNLYGWYLVFQDQAKGNSFKYIENDWKP